MHLKVDPRKDPRKKFSDPHNPHKNYDPRKILTHVKNILTHITHATHVKNWPMQPMLPWVAWVKEKHKEKSVYQIENMDKFIELMNDMTSSNEQ